MASLGFTLFNDPKLSSNGKVSCASCHNLATNGAEITPVSTGVKGAGDRNSLTVFNSSLNYRFFWDGRANTLLEQLDGPVENPLEMDSSWEEIETYVLANTHYKEMFTDAGLKISTDNIKLALTEFMRALNTPNAPFDRYLEGDTTALNEQQTRGWNEFQDQGCINCHRGVNIGGGLVTRFGYFGLPDNAEEETSAKSNMFRVASLRNVAQTAPYFHDGSVESLREAITIMAKVQLGKELSEESVEDIHSFLQTLTGEKPQILQGGLNAKN
ncbi:cytochrome c551 peroxidase [Vibrio ishigakensis]|uniref:Cytochrome c551 peroxidase n=1 Tax=Vibrio ishigakensis TaxID=1481914 RepID=A0A0B8PFP1_9VIBR|nr:cytochrome c551 peroxidase [Vibrio ishigakensis]